MLRRGARLAAATAGVAATAWLVHATGIRNPATIALAFMLVVLSVAALADFTTAALASIVSVLAFNYFFLAPVGTLTLADPSNWLTLAAFLIVSIVFSRLSDSAKARARDAHDRRAEVTRLFNLTRDVLLTTESAGAMDSIARSVARRFNLRRVAICLPRARGGWDLHQGGEAPIELTPAHLDGSLAAASSVVEFDARSRSYGGHRTVGAPDGPVTLSPIRIGVRATGLLATAEASLEAGTRDAIAGVVAIALERSHFLEERRLAELAHQRAELSSALLASLSHDLRTPLTAIRAALTNLELQGGLDEDERAEQARVAAEQAERLTRLFDEILDMARIDAGAVSASREWVTPAEIVEAALTHAAGALGDRAVTVDADDDMAVEVDPRLTSSAFAHLVENAARYSPADGSIAVKAWTDDEGLRMVIRDEGPGLEPAEMEQLFEPFYRGRRTGHLAPGTGMGLSITRGLLGAQGGRVWAENVAPRGAAFSIAVPGRVRAIEAAPA